MVMKFGRAYCDQLGETLSPYQARELYTDEDSSYFGQELRFLCEDADCRVRLTPVGIYMSRKSKRALHFRTKEEHKARCGFLQLGSGTNKVRGLSGSGNEDEYKLTNFPTELDLRPRKRKGNGDITKSIDFGVGGDGTTVKSDGDHDGERRQTSTRTRYLDLVVDCFLSGDEESKKGQFTVAGKTKVFARFFKKIQYFGDETGLIYYGKVDGLKLYNGKGIGLVFAEPAWVDCKKYRVWVYVPQERIDESRRKNAFIKDMEELKKAVDKKEEVEAYFVGAYPKRETVTKKDGTSFDVYRAELLSIDHLSLVFAAS
jgi:hypothetical protein